MKIIALESSAVTASVAVTQDEALLAQSFQNSGLTHSATLMPMAADLLKNTGLTLDAIDVVAVAAGPGSFTGVRIGVAAAKGLAWPGDKPGAPLLHFGIHGLAVRPYGRGDLRRHGRPAQPGVLRPFFCRGWGTEAPDGRPGHGAG